MIVRTLALLCVVLISGSFAGECTDIADYDTPRVDFYFETVGDDVEFWLFAQGPGGSVSTIDCPIMWDPGTEIIGETTTEPFLWTLSEFFSPDFDGLNDDLDDGDAIWFGLSSIAVSPGYEIPDTGRLVSAFHFDDVTKVFLNDDRSLMQPPQLLRIVWDSMGCIVAINVDVTGCKLSERPNFFIRGDADNDLDIDDDDKDLILAYINSTDTIDCLDAADVNDDGVIDISDPTYLVLYLYSSGSPPPYPGPTVCGRDPTSDSLHCDVTCP